MENGETIERINLALLALGKLTDIAADWVIVVQVLQMTHGALGCTNTCEFARNFVCQDGQELTLAADVQSCAAGCFGSSSPVGNLSVLPAAPVSRSLVSSQYALGTLIKDSSAAWITGSSLCSFVLRMC